MNIQTYENCIKTLENQIKSRQHQRQSMDNTIKALDRDLVIEIHRNKTLREELLYVAQTNQNIINELHNFQSVIKEKDQIIESNFAADEGRRLHIQALEKQKVRLSEQLQEREQMIDETSAKVRGLDEELRNALQQISGYEKRVQEKNVELRQMSVKLAVVEQQGRQMKQKFQGSQKQQQRQREQWLKKLMQSQGSANSIQSELQVKITNLQQQLQKCKLLSSNQLDTLQFNKQAESTELHKQISSLKSTISSQLSQIAHFKSQQMKLKHHFEVQIQNNDKVVNTLINEINFLKQEKVQIKKSNSIKLEEVLQQIFLMGHELSQKQAKTKATQNQIKTLEDQLARKGKQISNLNKQIQKLNLQLQVASQEHTSEKESMLLQLQVASQEHTSEKESVVRKNEQIAELKRFIENLKKFAQVSDKQKQTLAKKSTKQIDHLKSQNIQLSQKLSISLKQLQQLRIKSAQLQGSVKFLTLQKSSTSSSVAELQALVKTHQYTIEKLQHMLKQTKKVVVDLNKLMKTKLSQIDSLEITNNLFRKQKLEWIQKQQDYRKKISQLKAISSAAKRNSLNETSFISKARKSIHDKDKTRTHSMLIPNSPDKDSIIAISSLLSNIRRKTMMASRANSPTFEDQSKTGSDRSNDSLQIIYQIPHAEKAFKKPQIMRLKKQSADLTRIPFETPVIPVLRAMRKEKENDKLNQSKQGQECKQKELANNQQRQCWQGLSANVIEALIQNGPNLNPISEQNSNTAQNQTQAPQITVSQNQTQAPQITVSQNQIQMPQITHQQTLPFQQSQDLVQIHVSCTVQVLDEGQKQVSAQTHPQTPTTNDHPSAILEARSQNLTPQFHVQSQFPDSPTSDKQQESNESSNPASGYQTLEQYQEQQRLISIPQKISPINSRLLLKPDQLLHILENQELNEIAQQNSLRQLDALKETDEPLSIHEDDHDSLQAQNTVDGINLLLDRINTE